MYTTGFISRPNNTYLRMKQGLMPQELASNCYQPSLYYPKDLENCQICNNYNLYPIKMPRPDYGKFPYSPNSQCLKYIEAP